MGEFISTKKKIIVGLVSIFLLVGVVDLVITYTTKCGNRDRDDSVSDTNRAVKEICAPTDYKETCEKSLSQANTTQLIGLLKFAFDAAINNVGDVIKNSTILKEAAADPSIKDAYNVCREVLETAVNDLKRSVDEIEVFDHTKAKEYAEDLKTWLSAVITNQETCIDAFENTTGDNGEKMKNLLRNSRELSSNALAMTSHVSSMFNLSNRRLLSEDEHAFVRRRLLEAARISLKPTIVVAKDGSGQFKTISDAIATLPKKNNQTIVVYVKAGLYKETVSIPKNVNNVMLVGDGPSKTRITGDKNFAAGVKTFHTATVAVNADDFLAKDIAFENTAGPEGHQAVALRVSGDKAIFFNVVIDGYQDTLYAHTYRQYYRDCSISGTIDFIFGDSLSVFQNCKFVVRKPGKNQACMVTAQGRVDTRSNGAIVIQNGHIMAEPAFLDAQPPIKAYLGRPWKELSRTIIMQSEIDGFIDPTGWSPWAGNFAIDTCYYGEYQNRGAGSNTANRVQWKGIKKITPQIAESWTGGVAYVGDAWITQAGVPYVSTMMKR